MHGGDGHTKTLWTYARRDRLDAFPTKSFLLVRLVYATSTIEYTSNAIDPDVIAWALGRSDEGSYRNAQTSVDNRWLHL